MPKDAREWGNRRVFWETLLCLSSDYIRKVTTTQCPGCSALIKVSRVKWTFRRSSCRRLVAVTAAPMASRKTVKDRRRWRLIASTQRLLSAPPKPPKNLNDHVRTALFCYSFHLIAHYGRSGEFAHPIPTPNSVLVTWNKVNNTNVEKRSDAFWCRNLAAGRDCYCFILHWLPCTAVTSIVGSYWTFSSGIAKLHWNCISGLCHNSCHVIRGT